MKRLLSFAAAAPMDATVTRIIHIILVVPLIVWLAGLVPGLRIG